MFRKINTNAQSNFEEGGNLSGTVELLGRLALLVMSQNIHSQKINNGITIIIEIIGIN